MSSSTDVYEPIGNWPSMAEFDAAWKELTLDTLAAMPAGGLFTITIIFEEDNRANNIDIYEPI